MPSEGLNHLQGRPDAGQVRVAVAPDDSEQPVEIIASKKAYRCRRRGSRSASSGRRTGAVGGPGSEPAEGDLSPGAPFVEEGGVVAGDPGGEDGRLPGIDARLVALQLLDDLEHPARA